MLDPQGAVGIGDAAGDRERGDRKIPRLSMVAVPNGVTVTPSVVSVIAELSVTSVALREVESLPLAVGVMLPPDGAGPGLRVVVTTPRSIDVRPLQAVPDGPGRLDVWIKPAAAAAPRLLGELPASGGRLLLGGETLDMTVVMVTRDARTPDGARSPGETLFQGMLTATR